MKVGDFVRFKTLSREIKIGKVIEIIAPDKNSIKKYCVYDLDNNEATVDDYVIKSSPKIIDLIEVGDYVNGSKVIDIAQAPVKALYTEDIKQTGALKPIINNEIESVLTHEQIESMEYKVKE